MCNSSDPFGLCPPKDDNKSDCAGSGSDGSNTAATPVRTTIQKVGDFAAGFGDFVSFGATKAVRDAWSCEDCVDYKSGAYTAGEVTGGVAGVAEGGLAAARAAGWTSKIALHEAHHAFPIIGKAAHIQVNVWRIGVEDSGLPALRIPWPWH